jgi:hypothetical protein
MPASSAPLPALPEPAPLPAWLPLSAPEAAPDSAPDAAPLDVSVPLLADALEPVPP